MGNFQELQKEFPCCWSGWQPTSTSRMIALGRRDVTHEIAQKESRQGKRPRTAMSSARLAAPLQRSTSLEIRSTAAAPLPGTSVLCSANGCSTMCGAPGVAAHVFGNNPKKTRERQTTKEKNKRHT